MATQTWDPLAYERNGAFVHELAGGVLEWLNPQAGEYVLDLGCGDGQLTQRIAASGAHVLGVDASAEMVAAARERGIEAEHARAEELPFRDATFDAVFSNAVLHWVRDQDAMMRQVHRVLKPGGRFVAEMGGHGNVAAIHVALTSMLDRYGFGDREKGVNYYPSSDSYAERLKRNEFDVERIALIPRPTRLPESGLEGWLRTFRRGVLEGLPSDVRERVIRETVTLLEPALRDEAGNWTADYVRLRLKAVRSS
ncbi:class I SAM-dependent methyltransferase [Occallatibacter savannae]|uniref:class I SAM-dependent methyltransferase n=1 Tax=Occallatibacter savannae TaxID=1002691 RepID=UPI000D699BC2|nr:class I SAM-dependent methyltransferase [Occallatibacter savannae]